MNQMIQYNLKNNLKWAKKYDDHPLRETLAKGLDPARKEDLDPKKPKRKTKINTNRDTIVVAAILIAKDVVDQILANVNVLKIERENNLTGAEKENDIVADHTTEITEITIDHQCQIWIIKFLLQSQKKFLCQYCLATEEKGSVQDRL